MADGVDNSITRSNFRPLIAKTGFAVLFLSLSAAVFAVESQVEVGFSERYTDNSKKSDTNTEAELETRPFLSWQLASDPDRCRGSFGGQLGYVEYHEKTFGNQSEISSNLTGICDVNRYLSWSASNDLRDVSRDTTQIDSPTNRTRRNVFSTGPSLTKTITSQDDLVLNSVFQNTEFRDATEADSERVNGGSKWQHRFNPTLISGLGYDYSRIWMDTGEDIYFRTVQVELDKRWTRTEISGSIGFTVSKSRAGVISQDSEGVVWSLSGLRQLDSRSSLTLDASRTISDLTSGFDIAIDDVQLNLQESSVVEVTDYRIGYNRNYSGGTQLSLGFFRDQRDYVRSNNHETDHGVSANISKPVDRHWTMNARIIGKNIQTDPAGLDADSLALSLGATYRWTEKWFLDSRIGHELRNVRNGLSNDFNENWIMLAVRYRLI